MHVSISFKHFQIVFEVSCTPEMLSFEFEKTAVFLFLECLFISGVKFFTFINRKMRTFDLLIVKGHTLQLLIVKCISYD